MNFVLIICTLFLGEQSEQTHVNYNINKTTQVEKISIENENKTNFSTSVENNAYVESHTIPSYENFIKLWAALNNTSHQSNEVKLTKETEKGMIVQLPFSFEKETKIDSNATGLNFINKMFESYISATKAVTTTIKPTTANYQQQNKVDIVSQQIMNMLNNNYGNHNKTFVDRKSEEIKSHQTSTSKINDYVSEAVHIKEQSMDNEERTILKPSEIDNSISRNTTQKPNFKNLVNLWIQLNKTNHQDKKIKEIEKSVTVRATFDQVTKTSSQAKDFDLINKILRSYFSQEAVTTIKPTTPEKEIDILPQIIKKFLKNHSIHYNTTLGDRTLDETFKNRNADINYFRDEKLLKSNETGPLVQHFENLKKLENNLRIDKTRSSLNKHMPIHLNENTNADSQLKYIEMLKDYIAAKYMQTSTQLPTTTPKLIDVILQKINDFFRNNYIDDQKVTVNGASEPLGNRDLNTLKTHHNNDQDWLTHRSVSMQSNNELHDQYQSTIPRPYETKTKDKQSNNLQIVQANDEVRSQKMPITVNNESKNDCHSKELDHIFHMFENYIATKDAETTISVPTLTPTHFDVIAQKLKEYLDSNDNKYRRIMVTQVHAQNQSAKVPQVHDGKLLVNRKIDYMKETQRQANQLNIDDLLDISSKKLGQSNNSQTVQYKLLKVNMLNDTTNPEAKLLSEDVIREITEKVKASVLKDLQKQMFTTLRSVTKDTTSEYLIEITYYIFLTSLLIKDDD